MALLLWLYLSALSHLTVRVFHTIIPSTVQGRSVEPAVILVRPHGCARIAVILDGPQSHASDEPAEEDKTHRFEYRDLEVGEYVVVVACVDDQDHVIQTVQTGLKVV